MDTTKQEEAASSRLIKRYANRKLYDTQESRYVTLQQIAEFIRDGQDVRIVDNRTKEDLTNVTLAQIIYEEEKAGESQERRGSLLTFIQTGRDRLITSLPKFPFRKDEKEGEGEKQCDFKAMPEEQWRAYVLEALEANALLRSEVADLRAKLEDLQSKLAESD